jgi:hypothetical protein
LHHSAPSPSGRGLGRGDKSQHRASRLDFTQHQHESQIQSPSQSASPTYSLS